MSEGSRSWQVGQRGGQQPDRLRGVLQRIATGPTMSKDLSRADACAAMRLVLDGSADPVQAGIFLIALRMKRETDDELAGVLDAVHAGQEPVDVAVPCLTTLVDPYDGYLRGTSVAAFLPAVLAASGLRVLTHGVWQMGPKFGATQEQVLAAAGITPAKSLAAAATAIETDAVGWSHVSQRELAPELFALSELRTRIVKRPCLTTLEVAVRALRPTGSSHLVTGFVHKGYPPIYASLAHAGGFERCVIIRGVEGGIVPSLSQASRYFVANGASAPEEQDLDPAMLGLDHAERTLPLPTALQAENDRPDPGARSVQYLDNAFAATLAEHAAEQGLAALDGAHGMARDSLLYAGAVILVAGGHVDSLVDGAERVAAAIDSGEASARLHAG